MISPSVELLRVDEPFYNEDGSIRFAEGRRFLYADDDHLSDAGAERVRETWRRAIAAATLGARSLTAQGASDGASVSRAMRGGSSRSGFSAGLADSAGRP